MKIIKKSIYLMLLSLMSVGNVQLLGAESGDLLYRNNCATCHGADGSGTKLLSDIMGLNAIDFRRFDTAIQLANVDLVELIEKGRPKSGMPALGGSLTKVQIETIVYHLQSKILPQFSDIEYFSKGQAIYRRHCSVCHGDDGQVAIWAKAGLDPMPANFSDDEKRKQLKRQNMIFSVTNGRPDTAMTSWSGRFDKQQIEQVVDYIRVALMDANQFDKDLGFGQGKGAPQSDPFMSAKTFDIDQHDLQPTIVEGSGLKTPVTPDPFLENPNYKSTDDPTLVADDIFDALLAEHDHSGHSSGDLDVPLPANMLGNLERGKQLYNDNCAACHGEKGDGKGPRAYFIFPKPRNFHHPAVINRFTRPHIFNQVSKGILGTVMPAWKRVLGRQQIADVTEYLFVDIIHQNLPIKKQMTNDN